MSKPLIVAVVFLTALSGGAAAIYLQSVGMITASLWAFYGVGCALPVAIGIGISVWRHRSLRPALQTIAIFLIVGVAASVLTDRDDDT